MRCLVLLVVMLSSLGSAAADLSALIQNIPNRTTISLNGPWQAIVDPYETGLNARFYLNAKAKDKHELVEYDFDKSDVLNVPGDWNSQKKELFFYEGPVWYKKSFSYHKREHSRVFVYFGAANYFTRVYLNGQALGEHEGGFTPFDFEVTGQIRQGDNFLVAEVNNARRRDAVPTVNTDWWNYGGVTRDVMLVEVPESFIQDYLVQLAKGSSQEVAGWVQLNGSTSAQRSRLKSPRRRSSKALPPMPQGALSFTFPPNSNYGRQLIPNSTMSSCRAARTGCTIPSASGPSNSRHSDLAQRQAHLSARYRHA